MLLRMKRRPTHTMTTARMGALSTGRMTTRSMTIPPTKAMARVAAKAAQ
jgi:hypothetical protein